MSPFYNFLFSMYRKKKLTAAQLEAQVPIRISRAEFEQILNSENEDTQEKTAN